MRTMHMLHSLDVETGNFGSTVRNGFKWADVKFGEEIGLCVCTRDPETHVVAGRGRIVTTWVGRFMDIPSRLLQYEHEVRSREYRGLRDSMRKAYGAEFSEEDYVTLVLYRRIG